MPDSGMANPPVLEVADLTVRFRRRNTDVAAVNGASFSLQAGETLTILGESGSGKSVSLKALMGLLPNYAQVTGKVWLNGNEILGLPAAALAKLRGGALSMIFQEPMAALDPVYTIGEQIAETIIQHDHVDHRTAMKRALGLLEQVKIPSAERRLKNYPHEMSGGMRQRAMIALALACSPAVLLADEPTTALDVTVQIQILLLLRQLQQELGMAIVFVTHDVGAAASLYRGPAALDRTRRHARHETHDNSRHAAQPGGVAPRLCVRPALPLCGRCVPGGGNTGGDFSDRRNGAVCAGGGGGGGVTHTPLLRRTTPAILPPCLTSRHRTRPPFSPRNCWS
jgi:ABC-type dipeptide/oligopeptide/nickel transport system ATPase subunit